MKKCRDCGISHNDKNKLCDTCSARARKTVKKRTDELMKRGLCGICGKNNKLPNIIRCQECRDKINAQNKVRVDILISQNRCSTCGRDKSKILAWHTGRCPGCHLKYKFSYTGTKQEAETLINDLLANQNFKCALSGRCLRSNKYHIDHISPKSLGGGDEPSNWQLIVDEANVFKNKMSMDKIIKLAQDIVSHNSV